MNDGLELRDSAAEYVIAWESLEYSPTQDSMYGLLKEASEQILKLEEEEKVSLESSWDQHIMPGKLPLLAFDESTPLSNHAWIDGLMSAGEFGHAAWPTYAPPSFNSPYREQNFPFSEINHPLLRKSARTGMPAFVGLLRDFYLGGHAQKEKEMEQEFIRHLEDTKSPVLHDFIPDKKEPSRRLKILGDPRRGSPDTHHAVDLYDRDFKRWKSGNPEREDYWNANQELLGELGYTSTEEALRNEHFDDRARSWVEQDEIDGQPTALGHKGYHMGLEWLSPRERATVRDALNNGIQGSKNHHHIKLPDGTLFSTSRLGWNMLSRMTPEMDWATRGFRSKGRNAHLQLEDNDRDYKQGDEGRFLQHGLGQSVWNYMDDFDTFDEDGNVVKKSFHERVLEMIQDAHGKESKLDFLPKFKNLDEVLDSDLSLDDIKEASKAHFRKGKQHDPTRIRFTSDELYFLAGYDPRTRTVMANHPMYGVQNPNEPQINAATVEKLIENGSQLESLERMQKQIRNDLSFLRAAHGPHPEEERPPMWAEGDGFTYGPGAFWDQPFRGVGGQNMSLGTYNDIIHSVISDDDGNSFMFRGEALGGQDSTERMGNGFLAHHFMPPMTQTEGIYDTTAGKFTYLPKMLPLRNILSPAGVSTVKRPNAEGATHKNNHTLFKHSLSPLYEYEMRRAAMKGLNPDKTFESVGTKRQRMSSELSHNQFMHRGAGMNYAAMGSGHHRVTDGLRQAVYLGLLNHTRDPPNKSVSSYHDVISGQSAFPAGESLDEFVSLMGWGGAKLPTLDRTKYKMLDSKNERPAVTTISNIAQILNSTNPAEIQSFLNSGDLEHAEQFLEHINQKEGKEYPLDEVERRFDEAKAHIPVFSEHARREMMESGKKGKSGSGLMIDAPRRGIAQMLAIGAALPAMEEEQSLSEEMTRLMEDFEQGKATSEEVRPRLNEVKQRLNELQMEAQKGALGEVKSDWWKTNEDHHMEEMRQSRNLVAGVANYMRSIAESEDPTAFDPNEPEKAWANMLQIFHDAERYISSFPHSVHGLTRKAYGLKTDVVSRAAAENVTYEDIASHVGQNGYEVQGTESPEALLEILGMDISPGLKEHAQQVIDAVNKAGYPMNVSTIGQILTSGGLDSVKLGKNMHDATHMHHRGEEFMGQDIADLEGHDELNHAIHTHGYSQAIPMLQQQKYQGANNRSTWKGHPIHRLPATLARAMVPPMFGETLDEFGLRMIHSDAHGRANHGSKNTYGWMNANARNNADAFILHDPMAVPTSGGTDDIQTIRGWHDGMPVGAGPNHHAIYATYNTGHNVHFQNEVHEPTIGFDFESDGRIFAGPNPSPLLATPVPQDHIKQVFGNDWYSQVQPNLNPPLDTTAPWTRLDEQGMAPVSDNYETLALSEASALINGLLDPEVLFTKEDDAEWVLPIRPMHRIFELSDLEHLRGFSGSWAVSKWYDGKRVMVVKNGKSITVLDENNRKVGVKKKFREALEKLNERDYAIDAILGDEEMNVIDIVNYDNNDISDMQMFERIKVLRSQFDSHDCVIVPGPHDTKMTDEEGLAESVKRLQDEHETILLRDTKSTYMRGEARHPKWIVLRPSRDFNFIILDRRGTGPYTYQLGAGPILDGSVLGNRAVEHDGNDYMDVGTARNQQKPFKVGDIVRVSISGVTKKNRGGRNVYTVHVREIEGEGEGEGAASAESLDLLTKSYPPTFVPFDIDVTDSNVMLKFDGIGTVTYKVEAFNDAWHLYEPKSELGDMHKSDYPVQIAESISAYWTPFVPLLLEEVLVKAEDKPPNIKEQQKESAGLLDEEDERILKPESKKKALDLITRTIDRLAKERMTWTGPKGLGIDVATPVESPQGPTKVTEERNLPDYDPKGEGRPVKEKKRTDHVVMPIDGEQPIVLNYENDQPVISPS